MGLGFGDAAGPRELFAVGAVMEVLVVSASGVGLLPLVLVADKGGNCFLSLRSMTKETFLVTSAMVGMRFSSSVSGSGSSLLSLAEV